MILTVLHDVLYQTAKNWKRGFLYSSMNTSKVENNTNNLIKKTRAPKCAERFAWDFQEYKYLKMQNV